MTYVEKELKLKKKSNINSGSMHLLEENLCKYGQLLKYSVVLLQEVIANADPVTQGVSFSLGLPCMPILHGIR